MLWFQGLSVIDHNFWLALSPRTPERIIPSFSYTTGVRVDNDHLDMEG